MPADNVVSAATMFVTCPGVAPASRIAASRRAEIRLAVPQRRVSLAIMMFSRAVFARLRTRR